MKKLWLYLISAAFVFTGCRLDSVSPVKNKVTTNTGSSFSVSSLFQNNMVIQRDQPVAIWGQAPTGTTVTVSVSWKASALQTVADNSGNWKVLIPASPANANPQTITLKAPDATTVVFSNVLLGDVWICSGQSNMVMPMDSIPPFDGVTNYQQEIAAANYPAIRLLTVQEDNEAAPLAGMFPRSGRIVQCGGLLFRKATQHHAQCANRNYSFGGRRFLLPGLD
jgi:sialate O-acetylesterase